jgi:hypothetical protein
MATLTPADAIRLSAEESLVANLANFGEFLSALATE